MREEDFDLMVRSEKVHMEEGASRVVRGFPWAIRDLALGSARVWQPVVGRLWEHITSGTARPDPVAR